MKNTGRASILHVHVLKLIDPLYKLTFVVASSPQVLMLVELVSLKLWWLWHGQYCVHTGSEAHWLKRQKRKTNRTLLTAAEIWV